MPRHKHALPSVQESWLGLGRILIEGFLLHQEAQDLLLRLHHTSQ